MGRARASGEVPVTPADAFDCWVDTSRWPTFVDGFARTLRVDSGWPAEGSEVVWQSTPSGRGQVSERVLTRRAPAPGPDIGKGSGGEVATRVSDEALTGTQTATFSAEREGTRIELELAYELSGGGILQPLTDVLFIRRSLRDSLRRTLERFAAEAQRII